MARRNRVNPGTPDAVKRAERKSDKLHKKMFGDPNADMQDVAVLEGAPVEEATGVGEDTQPVDTQAPPVSTGETPASAPPHPEPAGAPAEAPVEAAAVAPEPVAPPAAQQPPSEWEQRYNTLQGKYNAEMPRMAADIRVMTSELAALRAEAATRQATAAAPAQPEVKKNLVSEQDIVDYGEDLVDFIRRVARGEASEAAEQLTPRIEQMQGQMQQATAQQATNTVYSKLDGEVQDWRTINRSADFLAWLDQTDPYAGAVRKNLLGAAFQAGDGERVLAFFKGYMAERQAVTPQAPIPQQAPTPAPAPAVSLDKLAGPAGGPSATGMNAGQQPQAPEWTRDGIAQFYRDVSLGKYANNPKREGQIEASIAAALKAGRIN